ncbi:DUF2384 domain-containing protein [soil metagenome]
MVTLRESGDPGFEERQLGAISDLLGGEKVFGKKQGPRTPLEVHEFLVGGLPGRSILYLVDDLTVLRWADLEPAMGMSLRTFQRLKHDRRKTLSHDQGSRAWKFAEVLALASSVFGSRESAEQWLGKPATGLDGHRPVDLLATQTGTELVETFLQRLDHGVYV